MKITIQIIHPSQFKMSIKTAVNTMIIIDAKNESFCGVLDFIETIVDIYYNWASKVIFI